MMANLPLRNIPSKIFYASISSEILRIARTTPDLTNMVRHINLSFIDMDDKAR